MLQARTTSPLDEEQAQVSDPLEIILWTLMAGVFLIPAGIFILPSSTGRWLGITFSCYALFITVFVLNRRGLTRLAGILLITGLWILLTVFAVTAGGISSYAAMNYLIVIFIAGLLMGPRAAIITALLTILSGLGLVVIEMLGLMPFRVLHYTPLLRWLSITVTTVIVMGLQYLGARTIREALRQTRRELEERKRVESALRASEEQFRTLIEQAPDAIFIANSNLQFIETNTSACELMGYTREEILNSKIPDFAPTEDSSVLMTRLERLRSGETITAERNVKKKDGTLVPVEMTTKMLSDGRLQAITRDITERVRADTALRASEKRFAIAFNSNPVAAAISTLEGGQFLAVNDQFLKLTGYSRDEVLGRTAVELNMWPDLSQRVTLMRRLRKDGRVRNFEARSRSRNGDQRIFLLSVEQIELDGQQCMLHSAHDITERQQAEERLALLQMITMDVAAATDLHSALEVVLRRVCEKTGWVLGQAWIPNAEGSALDCCPAWFATEAGIDEFRAATTRASLALGKGLPGRVWEARQPVWIRDVTVDPNFPRADIARKVGLKAALAIPILDGDKMLAVLEFFLREPRDEDERLVNIISAIATQIGLVVERKQAEDALRDSQAKYRGLINSVDGIVWEADAKTFEFTFVSDQAERLLGYPTEQWIKEPTFWKDHIHPEDQAWAIQYCLQATRLGRPHEFEYRMLAADGRIVWLRDIVTIVRENGEVTTLRGIMVDATERKLADDALKSSSKQLRALSARIHSAREEEGTRIAREIHDELGSALTGLKWDLEKIDSTLSSNHSDVSDVRTQIATMTTLIESTIDTVRRISSELRPGMLDDLGLLAAIEWQAHQFQSRTGINYHSKTKLQTVKLSHESATAVFRIFQEILTNVLRHSQATDVYVDVRNRARHLELEVKDNGRGISESEKGNMRSLGLLGMRERALLVGGEVNIAGELGKGTTVVVRVPT